MNITGTEFQNLTESQPQVKRLTIRDLTREEIWRPGTSMILDGRNLSLFPNLVHLKIKTLMVYSIAELEDISSSLETLEMHEAYFPPEISLGHLKNLKDVYLVVKGGKEISLPDKHLRFLHIVSRQAYPLLVKFTSSKYVNLSVEDVGRLVARGDYEKTTEFIVQGTPRVF